jgi:coenzyme PQQ precursor peptide PqqA
MRVESNEAGCVFRGGLWRRDALMSSRSLGRYGGEAGPAAAPAATSGFSHCSKGLAARQTKILQIPPLRMTPFAAGGAINKRRLGRQAQGRKAIINGRLRMTWTAPEACEVCVGMEVTSYMSAEI